MESDTVETARAELAKIALYVGATDCTETSTFAECREYIERGVDRMVDPLWDVNSILRQEIAALKDQIGKWDNEDTMRTIE